MENLENSQPIHMERNHKIYSRENKGVTKYHLTVSAHRPGRQRGYGCSVPLYIAAGLLLAPSTTVLGRCGHCAVLLWWPALQRQRHWALEGSVRCLPCRRTGYNSCGAGMAVENPLREQDLAELWNKTVLVPQARRSRMGCAWQSPWTCLSNPWKAEPPPQCTSRF